MIPLFDPLRDVSTLSVFFRVVFAFFLGAVIGLERSVKNRPAGFRTHILVSVATCIAATTGIFLYLNLHMPTDISRIGAQAVSGLGFIGAGTIVVTKKPKIKGLTTAGLWASGIMGLAVGAGFYEGAVVATALVILTQTVFSLAESRIRMAPAFNLTFRYQLKPALDNVMRFCKDNRMAIVNLSVARDTPDEPWLATLTLRPQMVLDRDDFLREIMNMDGVTTVEAVSTNK